MTPALDTFGTSSTALNDDDLHGEVLDMEGLCARCMGNLGLVHRMLGLFEERTPTDMGEIDQALKQCDIERIARVAHRIKGASGNMSAESLRQVAGEIESLGRMGRIADVPARLERLHQEWDRYLQHIASLVATARRE